MDLIPTYEHLCYVRCNFCNTFLEVSIPCKRLLDTVTVKCGQCSSLSFLTARPPPLQTPILDHSPTHDQLISISTGFQASCAKSAAGSRGSKKLSTAVGYLSPLRSNSKKKMKKNHQLHCSSPNKLASTSTDEYSSSPKPHFVVKPPEKKHRLPSAYNHFMREEIQRIKAANPNIPHRDAFSAASKNWSRGTLTMPQITTISETSNNVF